MSNECKHCEGKGSCYCGACRIHNGLPASRKSDGWYSPPVPCKTCEGSGRISEKIGLPF